MSIFDVIDYLDYEQIAKVECVPGGWLITYDSGKTITVTLVEVAKHKANG